MNFDWKSSNIAVKTSPWRAAPAPMDESGVLFAIGDSHGYALHLAALQDAIGLRIDEAYEPADVTVAWLGDYIDRGPDPLACLDLAQEGVGRDVGEEIRLLGNHDYYLLEAASTDGLSQDMLENWLWNGGDVTLDAILPHSNRSDAKTLSRDVVQALGPDRIEFVRSLSVVQQVTENYVVVHAGVHPTTAFEKQRPSDLIWIREPFLEPSVWTHDFVVVHGHTPTGPSVRAHRIGVDSGVFATGILTAVEIAGDQMRFLHAMASGSLPKVDAREV